MKKEARIKKRGYGLFFFIITILLAASVFAGFSDFWNKITGLVTSQEATFSIVVSGFTPEIKYVFNRSAVSITEAGYVNVSFVFNASDADGTSDLNDSSAAGYFNKTGETTRRNSSCIVLGSNENSSQYNCTIQMWYWDGAGNWTINASIKDISGNMVSNISVSFELYETTAMVMGPTSISWTSVTLTDKNQTAGDDPIVVNNTANKNTTINITPVDLAGVTRDDEIIYAGNFSVEIESGGSCSGDACIECDMRYNFTNGTAAAKVSTAVDGANVTRGNLSAGVGNRSLYFCLVEIPPTCAAQTYNTNKVGTWTIEVS